MSDGAKIRLYIPNKAEHPAHTGRGLQINFRDVILSVTWDSSKGSLDELVANLPDLLAKARELEEEERQVEESTAKLDVELFDLLGDENGEEK